MSASDGKPIVVHSQCTDIQANTLLGGASNGHQGIYKIDIARRSCSLLYETPSSSKVTSIAYRGVDGMLLFIVEDIQRANTALYLAYVDDAWRIDSSKVSVIY